MQIQVSFDTGAVFTLPVNPEQVSITKDGRPISFSALRTGDYPIAAGRQPEQLTFTVLLPGQGRTWLVNPADWQPPQTYIKAFEAALDASRSRAYVACDDADFDIGAWYLIASTRQDFDSAQGGSLGDVRYTLVLTEERRLAVFTTDAQGTPSMPVPNPPPTAAQVAGTQGLLGTTPLAVGGTNQALLPSPDGAPTAGYSYTVAPGDTFASILQRAYGSLAYSLTPSQINSLAASFGLSSADTLQPGQVIQLPQTLNP